MDFPRPPGMKPLPPKPDVAVGTGPSETKLTANETDFLLDEHLRPEHRDDPNIIKFISSYLRCRNASQASREAGLSPTSGHNLKMRPDIYAAIKALTDKAVMKYGFDANEVVERVKEISNVDLVEFENPDGSYKTSLSEISPETRRAIKKFKAKNIYETDPNGMKIVTGQLIEVELWDKMKAVELLGREKDLFKETRKIEHDITKNMASTLLDSKKRGEQRLEAMREVGQLPAPTETTATEEVIDVTNEGEK